MFSKKIQLLFSACFCLVVLQFGCRASAHSAKLDAYQKEPQASIYQPVLDKVVQRIQMNLKQNTELKLSDMRLMIFLMSEINKRRAEISGEEESRDMMYMRND